MMYQVPPPVAEAFGHELLIAAGRSDDDWSVRASGFAPQRHWFSYGTETWSLCNVSVPQWHRLSAAETMSLHGAHKHTRAGGQVERARVQAARTIRKFGGT